MKRAFGEKLHIKDDRWKLLQMSQIFEQLVSFVEMEKQRRVEV